MTNKTAPRFLGTWFWPAFRREVRTSFQTLAFAALTLCVGMAALTTVLYANENLESQSQKQADVLLGGDVEISDVRLLPEALIQEIKSAKEVAATSRVTSLVSMASLPQETRPRLVEILAIDNAFPLIPGLKVLPDSTYDQLKRGGLWVEKGFAETHALQRAELIRTQPIDDKFAKKLLAERKALRIGKKIFPIIGFVENDQMRDFASLSLSSRLYLAREVAQQQKLISQQSRLRDRLLIKVTGDESSPASSAWLNKMLEKLGSAKPALRSKEDALNAAFKPARSLFVFFNAIGFTALLLLGLGSAQGVHSYLERKKNDAQIMALLGAPWREIRFLYFGTVIAILLLTITLGTWLGGTLYTQLIAPRFGSFLAGTEAAASFAKQPLFFIKFAAAAVLLTFSFIFPGIMTFSQDRKKSDKNEAMIGAENKTTPKPGLSLLKRLIHSSFFRISDCVWLLSALALSFLVSRETTLNLFLVLILALLYLLIRNLVFFISRLGLSPQIGLPLPIRIAGSEISSRPSQSSLTLLLFTLSVCLLLFIFDVRENILSQINANTINAQRPNVFILDAPAQSIMNVEKILSKNASEDKILSEKLIRARLSKINNQTTESWLQQWERNGEDFARAERLFNRQQNLTSRSELITEKENEEIVAGKFWSKDSAQKLIQEVSVEAGLAKTLKLNLGDTITFDVQGVPVDVTITSFRRVKWQNFRPNFFFVLHPSVLTDAPYSGLLAAHIPEKQKRAEVLNSLFVQFPGITSIDATDLAQLVERLFTAVIDILRFLTTLLFIGALLNTLLGAWTSFSMRAKNYSLYRCLGANNTIVMWSIVSEFLVLATIGIGLGLAGRWMLGALTEKAILTIDDQLKVSLVPSVAISSTILIICLIVAVVSAGVILRKAPFRVLRSGL